MSRRLLDRRGVIVALVIVLVASRLEAAHHGRRPGGHSSSLPIVTSPHDDIWMIDTSGCGDAGCCRQVTYNRHECGCWNPRGREQLMEGIRITPFQTTVVFVHGIRTDDEWALMRGLQVYTATVANRCPPEPIRWIIWHWPADASRRPLKDFKVQSQLADGEAALLAQFLAECPTQAPIVLVGYSLGAEIALTALEQAIGQRGGAASDSPSSPAAPRFRVALVAAAAPNRLGELFACPQFAYDHIDDFLVLYNPSDRALRFSYRLADHQPRSIGEIGLLDLCVLDDCGARVRQYDVAQLVGPRHSVDTYFASDFVCDQIHNVVWGLAPQELARSDAAREAAD